jgi:hypothetical protein
MVQPQTVKVDLFSVAPQTIVYQATLTSAGVDRATAALKAGFANCIQQTGPRPEGCPQSLPKSGLPNGQWQLIGEPTQNMAFSVDSASNLIGSGHYQMVFSYSHTGTDGAIHVPAGGGYQAILNLSANDIAVSSIKAATGMPGLPRPAAATDQAVEAVVAPALKACAAVTSGNPGSCPQLFFFPDSYNYHWTLVTDPLLDPSVSYDPDTGLFTVKGHFDMKLTYKIGSGSYTTYSNTTTYIAYLFWDGQQLGLVTIDGQ